MAQRKGVRRQFVLPDLLQRLAWVDGNFHPNRGLANGRARLAIKSNVVSARPIFTVNLDTLHPTRIVQGNLVQAPLLNQVFRPRAGIPTEYVLVVRRVDGIPD